MVTTATHHLSCGILRLAITVGCLTIQACGGGAGSDDTALSGDRLNPPDAAAALPLVSAESHAAASGLLQPLDDQALQQLEVIEQYRLLNKLQATLFKGMAVDEFFDLSAGLEQPQKRADAASLQSLRTLLQTSIQSDDRQQMDLHILGAEESEVETTLELEPRYYFSNYRPRELPLARIHTYPFSRDVYVHWMAWHLTNTLWFSPAEQLDSASITDMQNIYRRLVNDLNSGASIRHTVFEHMRSEANWRRFRSPEDNTREMLELFLGIEDADADVPPASAACRDLYLTDQNRGYKLAYTDFPNAEPQTVLGSSVISCDDFYHVVANHERLIPTAAHMLVRFFFGGRSPEFHNDFTNALIAADVSRFEEIFTLILFSREYLLDTERERSFEEAFLATAEKLRWETRGDAFIGMASGYGGMRRAYMGEMGWSAMSEKLGRPSRVPTDSLSFANYHKALREELLLDRWRWYNTLGVDEPDAPEPVPLLPPPPGASAQAIADYETVQQQQQDVLDAMSATDRYTYDRELLAYRENLARHELLLQLTIPEWIDYLFIAVAGRRAMDTEKAELISLFDRESLLRVETERAYVRNGRGGALARLVFDYLSRLPEVYYLKNREPVTQ